MKSQIALVTFLATGVWSSFSQDFVNLDFNSAQLSAYGTGPAYVPASNAIPGWTGYLGTDQQGTMLYNSLSSGDGNLSIVGTNQPSFVYAAPIPGNNYTVVLQPGPDRNSSSLESVNASIVQTGLIPANAQSILFTALDFQALQVTIAGQVIPISEIGSIDGGYPRCGGNISAFAGQVAELAFTDLTDGTELSDSEAELAGISFSSSPIPEPGTLGLLASGGLFIGWRWRRSFRKVQSTM